MKITIASGKGGINKADLFILMGTTGEIMPASLIPHEAKEKGAKIVEVNTERTNFTNSITDLFLQGKATEIIQELIRHIKIIMKIRRRHR